MRVHVRREGWCKRALRPRCGEGDRRATSAHAEEAVLRDSRCKTGTGWPRRRSSEPPLSPNLPVHVPAAANRSAKPVHSCPAACALSDPPADAQGCAPNRLPAANAPISQPPLPLPTPAHRPVKSSSPHVVIAPTSTPACPALETCPCRPPPTSWAVGQGLGLCYKLTHDNATRIRIPNPHPPARISSWRPRC